MFTPIERLRIFLVMRGIECKLNQIQLHSKPGFIIIRTDFKTIQGPPAAHYETVDIRGAGYAAKENGKYVSRLRLWNELHEHFSSFVDVTKIKNGQATKIVWNGCTYHLDHYQTYKERKANVRNDNHGQRKGQGNANRSEGPGTKHRGGNAVERIQPARAYARK